MPGNGHSREITMQHHYALAPLLALLLTPLLANGQGLQWGVGTGLGWDDNINRVSSNGESETIAAVVADIGWQGEGPRHRERIRASATYANYLDNTYSSEIIRGVTGDIELRLIPETLHWNIANDYGSILANPFGTGTPDNRTYANYFTTGPTLTLGAGGRTQLVVDPRYGRATYRDSVQQADNDQLGGRVGLVRRTSPTTAWSINGAARSVDYDESGLEDYDIYEGYLRFDGGGGRTRIQADGGVTRLEYEDRSQSNTLWRLDLSRELTERATLAVSFGTQWGDSADGLRRLGQPFDTPTVIQDGDLTTLASPLRDQFINAELRLTGVRTFLTVGANFNDQEFESDTELSSQRRRGFSVDLLRQINDALDVVLRASTVNQDYQSAGREDEDYNVGVTLSWRFASRTFLTVGYRYETRDSDDNLAEYDANMYSVGVYFSPTGNRWTFGY